MRCLIVAAGQGSRLQDKGPLKPLVEIGGAPLIEHVIMGARVAGASGFVVVSGFRGAELRTALDALAERESLHVTHVINDAWERPNGLSVLAALSCLEHEPFILTMCDHLVAPDLTRTMMMLPIVPDTVTLGVDFNIIDPLNDPEDATRVKCQGDRIERIGKMIDGYDAFDTGVFLCTPAIFIALEESASAGDDSISGAMTVLAKQGRALVHDIGTRLWVDVDDTTAYDKASALLAMGWI